MSIYDILLNTPMGKKRGELTAKIENGRLIGYLSLLGHTEPIDGSVDENGNCELKGKLITLLNTIPFTANGTIKRDSLRLRVRGKRGIYEMLGASRRQEERDNS